jgi:phage terminase large subunit
MSATPLSSNSSTDVTDDRNVTIAFKARDWQRALIRYFRPRNAPGGGSDGTRAMVIAHRRAGKDRAAMFIELEQANRSPREVWHCLPSYRQARKVLWDALTRDGERLIDVAFPRGLRKKTIDDEMKIELKNGSLWRAVGADNFDALVGANPRHVTFSEYALTSPKAYEFVRPILAENEGTALFITTPRGFNHAHALYQQALASKRWYTGYHPVSQTKLIPDEVLEEERRTMPDELYRQEWECDWSAANIGSILGRYLEQADKELRLVNTELYDPNGAGVELFSDIGFRDAAAWWWIQPLAGGYHILDYDEGTGLDAEQWIERIRAKPWSLHGRKLAAVHLPHDARAKTFRSRHTVVDVFLNSKLAERYAVVPDTSIADRINAARVFMRTCRFNVGACAAGLHHLREWHFRYDDEQHVYSREPDHDEHSHGGDAFSYAAVALKPAMSAAAQAEIAEQAAQVASGAHYAFDLNRLFAEREDRAA